MTDLLRRWLLRGLGCLGVCLFLAGLPVQVLADSPPGILRVVFRGVEEMSPSALREVMHLRQPSWWNPFSKHLYHGTDHLEPDLARILAHYRDEGFIFARIEGALVRYLSEDWVEIEIDVDEGMRIYVRSASLRGTPAPMREQLEEEVEVRPGQPLREPKLRRDAEAVKRICRDLGYALTEISRETRFRGDSADVFYQVELGPLVRVGQIDIEGFERTKEHVIRREVKLKEGDTFRLSRVAITQDRLFDLGLFRTARIVPSYSDTALILRRGQEVQVDLKVVVGEKPPGWFGLGLGYTTDERGILQAEWGYRNLLGRAWGLQVIGEVSYYSLFRKKRRELDDRRLEMIFTMPWLVKLPVRCQVRPYYRFNHEQDFDEDVIGISLRNRYRLSRGREGLAEIEFKTTATDSFNVPGGAQGRVSTHLLSLAVTEDRRDFPVDPRSGHFAQAMSELAGWLGGEITFTRLTATYAKYTRMGERFTWARRVRVGYTFVPAGEDLPFDERFFVGGGTTVRGYGYEDLGPRLDGAKQGGRVMVVLNAELRLRLFWQFGGVLFLDAGNVWEDFDHFKRARWLHSAISTVYSELDVAYAIGAGLRLATPVGPLRLDYGYKARPNHRDEFGKGEVHLSLGQVF